MEKNELKTIDIPLDIHTKLKTEASSKGKKIKDFLIEILKKELKIESDTKNEH